MRNKKTKTLVVRLTNEENDALDHLSKANYFTRSDVIRKLIAEKTNLPEKRVWSIASRM